MALRHWFGVCAHRLMAWQSGMILALMIMATPVAAQSVSTGGAFIEIPTVSELDVESATAGPVMLTANGAESSGVFRIRVRANHPWKVVLSSQGRVDQALWVRAVGPGADGEFQRLHASNEEVVLSGEPGERILEVEYRWVSESTDVSPSLPLTYTLASL